MNILSLNAWHGERQAELQDFLATKIDSTDVFCFQETNGERMECIMTELFDGSRFSYVHASKITDTERRYSLHTFVKDPLQIIGSEELFDSDDSETGCALAVKIKNDKSAIVAVMNVHGVPFKIDDKRDTAGRLRQTETMLGWLETNGNPPSVICGDFNLLPDTKSIRMFADAGFQDLIADYRILTTRNRLAWEKHPDNIQLFADYTFVSQAVQVESFDVPSAEVSDHLPMVLEVTIDNFTTVV